MRLLILPLCLSAACAIAQSAPPRPKITGIDHVDFYTTSPEANHNLYVHVLGLTSTDRVEPQQIQRYIVGTQWIGYSAAPDTKANNRMDHIAFRTEDCAALRTYLATHGVKVPDHLSQSQNGDPNFVIDDPEGHRVEFIQRVAGESGLSGDPVSRHLIHAGFIVRDRAAEDHFYKDILGFHIYWHGGMKDSDTDWVAMQVPDGTDWLEYMLNVDAHPDLQLSGVMNHISLGVRDMKQAQAQLEAHGWKPHGEEKSQMGKDGKWQLNLFDPDFTRIELMELKPSQKPCCSEFTGPHPRE